MQNFFIVELLSKGSGRYSRIRADLVFPRTAAVMLFTEIII